MKELEFVNFSRDSPLLTMITICRRKSKTSWKVFVNVAWLGKLSDENMCYLNHTFLRIHDANLFIFKYFAVTENYKSPNGHMFI